MATMRVASALAWPLALALAGVLSHADQAHATSTNRNCLDCPSRIRDHGTVEVPPVAASSQVNVPGLACDGGPALGGIDVRVDVLHANIGDLRLRLLTPSGDNYVLLNQIGDGGGSGSCAGDDLSVTFSGTDGVQAACSERIPAVGGVITPQIVPPAGPIESGTWTLQVFDHAANGDGVLQDWTLYFYCDAERTVFKDGFDG